jgi:YcaO-like protein with predicted kinase domain
MEGLKLHRDGTDRICSPDETLERINAKGLRKLCGITRVANLTGLDSVGVPVVSVCRPNSRSIVVAQGKGGTLAAAKASGLMEAIEAYHAETPRLPLRLCSLRELEPLETVEVTRLPGTSAQHVRADSRILWTEADDIARGCKVMVPYEMVHTDYTLPLPTGSGSFLMSSNGLASGNHLLEAISHAICELVERDAVTLHAYRPETERRSRRVDLATIDDSLCREVLDRFEVANVACHVADVTSDVGMAAFRCDVANEATMFLAPACRRCAEPAATRDERSLCSAR